MPRGERLSKADRKTKETPVHQRNGGQAERRAARQRRWEEGHVPRRRSQETR